MSTLDECLKASYKILLRDNPSTNTIKLLVIYRGKRIPSVGNWARMARIAYDS